MGNPEKNARIRESGRATRVKRATQQAVTRELKLNTSSLTAVQREALTRVFLEAKWVYNQLVTSEDYRSWDTKSKTVSVRLPDGSFEERPLLYLGSQVKQSIPKGIESSIKTLAALKKQGKKVGALRPNRLYSSLTFVQEGRTWALQASKLRLQGLPGRYRVRGFEQLAGLELTSAKLVKKASGYYLKVTGFRAPLERESNGLSIGLYFGVKTHITTSEGQEFNATIGETERLKRLQRKLQRAQRGSNNRSKTLAALGREYEELGRRKDDLANKLVASLAGYEKIVLQDEHLAGWAKKYGRTVQHSVLGRVKAKLSHLPQTIMLDRWAPSTQLCPECGTLRKLALRERQYSCECGYSAPRDQHAASNMLLLAKLSPEGLGGAPVDWKTAVASFASSKSRQVEAGSETAQELVAETRSSSVVA